MNTECIRIKETKTVSRETASGVWYISYFIKSLSSHQNFPKKQSKVYYEKAYELINDLAFYYFMGVSPYQSEQEINSKILELNNLYVGSCL
ncbi:protein of unknown function [Tenacibaculum sp. 190524A02b]|uniref:hypothetical protein n=1 Tax=Tenacibaculum vairaonense TaxID=3137860 RepID=UPI0032B1F133